jgi:hypothetical protein
MNLSSLLLSDAVRLCVVAAGVFFMAGLLTGAWKYAHIARSPSATAPVYVDIAHRTSLLYSFAALLLAVFAYLSAWGARTNWWAAAVPLLFFGLAIATYVLHGILRDTDNQFQKPYRVGSMPVHGLALHGFTWALMLGEIGGFAVLFAGTLRTFGYL